MDTTLSRNAASDAVGRPLQVQANSPQQGESNLDILDVLRRQLWLVTACISAGITLATLYYLQSEEWYQTQAKVLVTQRDARAATGQFGEAGTEASVSEETLADHMQLIRSRRIIQLALGRPAPVDRASLSAGAVGDPLQMETIDLGEIDVDPVPQNTVPQNTVPSAPLGDPIDVEREEIDRDTPAPPSEGGLPLGDPIDVESSLPTRFPGGTQPVAMLQVDDPIDVESNEASSDAAGTNSPASGDESGSLADRLRAELNEEFDEEFVEDEGMGDAAAFSERWLNTEEAPEQETTRRPGTRLRLADLDSITSHLEDDMDAVDYVIEHLKVTMGGDGAAKSARSLNIIFEHDEPRDAKAVLEAIVLEYQLFLDNQLRDAAEMIASLASDRLTETEKDLEELEEQYVKMRKNAPLLYSSEGSNPYVDAYRTLQDNLLDVEVKESSTRTRLAKVLDSLDRIEENAGSDLEKLALIDAESLERLGMFASLQMGAASSIDVYTTQPERIAAAQAKYQALLEMKAELDQKQRDFGNNNPEVVALRDRIRVYEAGIDDSETEITQIWGEDVQLGPETLLLAYVGFLKHDLAALDEQRTELTSLMATAERDAKSLTEFELTEETLRAKIERKQEEFDSVIGEIREIDSASAFSGFIHELLEAPRVGRRSWPKLPLCLVGGVLIGLVGGLLAALFNDRNDNRFRTVSQVERELGLSVLGRVGKLPPTDKDGGHLRATALAPEGEAFRSIRTVLLPEVKGGRLRTLGTTSPISGDGKSTTMANLAASFAQAGLTVLVIDGDMRRPTVHKQLGIPLGKGLSNVLRGQVEVPDVVKPTPIDGLSAMTAGSAVGNPAELLQGETFTNLLELLKTRFDLVLIDLGPVLAVSDPLIASQRIDGMLLVTRVANDSVAQARDAVARLRASGATLLGAVVNTFGVGREFGSGDGYYGYYGEYGSYSTASREKEIRESEAAERAEAARSNGKTSPAAPPSDATAAGSNGAANGAAKTSPEAESGDAAPRRRRSRRTSPRSKD